MMKSIFKFLQSITVISLRMEPLSFKLVNILAKSAPQFEDVSIIIMKS